MQKCLKILITVSILTQAAKAEKGKTKVDKIRRKWNFAEY